MQDALISILSEKTISIPELGKELNARKGFSIIATANTRDRGVNEMSTALKRRFNMIVLPARPTLKPKWKSSGSASPKSPHPMTCRRPFPRTKRCKR
ncbi:hypothetical protein HMSSN036_00330 [Paenibacillus macerans]|nr:hypothetical protein HMSSN036_00330 [Paenibacillus macerans]